MPNMPNVCRIIKNNGYGEYQTINEISDRTSSRELENLKQMDILKKVGNKKGAYYEL